MKRIIYSLFILPFLFGCNPPPAIVLDSYVSTDAFGQTLFNQGNTTGQWTLNQNFTSSEEDLFNSYFPLPTNCNVDTSLLSLWYPNPSHEASHYCNLDSGNYNIVYRFVDEDLNDLYSFDILRTTDSTGIILTTFDIDIIGNSLNSGDIMRVYYLIISNDNNCCYKGYGNIKLQ